MKNINTDFVLRSLYGDGKEALASFKKNGKHLDWAWILAFSEKYKVCGLLFESLDRWGISKELPRGVQKRITFLKEEASQRTDHAHCTLKSLSRALNREKIPFLVLKGFIFAHEAYENPAVRPYHDIDLLVPIQLLSQTEGVLVSLGYRFYCPPLQDIRGFIPLGKMPRLGKGDTFSEEVNRDLFTRFHFHYPYVLPPDDLRLPIDLHWHLSFPEVLRFEPESLWNLTREKVVEGVPVNTLNLEATILHLVVKIAVEGPIELLSLCDLVRYLEIFRRNYDLQNLWSIAGMWDAQNFLRFSLKLAERLFGFDSSGYFGTYDKQNPISDSCFRFATHSSLIFEPVRGHGFEKFSFIRMKRSMSRFCWDISLKRFPRHSTRSLLRVSTVFNKKEA